MLRLLFGVLLTGLSSHLFATPKLSESEAAHLASQFIRIYESNAQISQEAVHQLAEAIGDAYSYVIIQKPRWRGTSQSLLICSTKILSTGICQSVEGAPSPWLTPQEFIETIWPDKSPVVKSVSYYPSNASIYVFYSFVDRKKHDDGRFQDPMLTQSDVPWSKLTNNPKNGSDQKKKRSNSKVTSSPDKKTKPAGVVKLPYKNLFVSGKDIQDYDSGYFTVKLRSFDTHRDARIFRKTLEIPTTYVITSRKDNKRIVYVYFGIFPTEDDVYKAIETLPSTVIRMKPSLHHVAQPQLQDHIYMQWKQDRIDRLRHVVSESLKKEDK